ncbi:two component sensor histidine kinase PhoR [Neoasaia chiangmaiensis NBRC 101099]|uniref:sensor histidine kinase n=1 Tax=Neoasaia chiangmaiensis TaxID=320497 RepID=UPI00119674C1|nr:ATP-binding protein [Neoasaia chiangmaiensis]GBR42782.1 two component sensor histidine kinase PhoR [Neoasaia chiangmaiensis NBRC 101099]GEN16194.1 two-component sensor histidine kinase [Neoasaia chiangmaiensis]
MELLPMAVVLLDPNGRILHANREAVAQFGNALNAVMRHPYAQAAMLDMAGEGAVSTQYELTVPVRRFVQVTFAPWHLDWGAPEWRSDAIIAVLDDRSEADALDRMRADFVAYASHELRTPLASLIGFIETLRGPAADDPAAQRQFLTIMAGQAARMQRLIDRLLYLSRVQRLEHSRPKELVSTQDIQDRLMDETAVLLRDADASFRMTVPEEDVFFPGDEDQIVQVILNLVENAVKYGGAGVAVRLTIETNVQNGLSIVVGDNGPGIEAQHLPRLTERFYRVETRNAVAQPSGTGLGLAIVKHIVDRHGGRLTIDSRLGVGTQCTIVLPLAL